jgi:Secretion system C-terminal sorting domain/PA14 domain
MKPLLKIYLLILVCYSVQLKAQTCPTATGDQTSYGTGDVWIGYVYNNLNFTDYMGFVNQGSAGNPNFDQSFGGGNVSYPTSTCATTTETFSVRYKLTKTLAAGAYTFLIGADDGVRLSIDGGTTYILNDFSNHGYREIFTTIALTAGTYNFVLEYYEDGGGNRVRFDFAPDCIPVTTDQTSYGSGDIWRGITYSNQNFTAFKGIINAGAAGNPNFDVGFGGDLATFATSDCPVLAETFSVRFKLTKNFTAGTYNITIGGDDGYRLSIDGGATFPYGNFTDHAYTTNNYTITLNGSTNLVFEFYENGGQNRATFTINSFSPLPIELLYFNGETTKNGHLLKWSTATEKNNQRFEILASKDGVIFNVLRELPTKAVKGNSNTVLNYECLDNSPTCNYYKLKQVDFDGKSSESDIIYLSHLNAFEKISLYPNPSSGSVFLNLQKSKNKKYIEILDAKGILVESYEIDGVISQFQFLPILNKGLYSLKVFSDDQVQILRLVKL